MCIPLDVRTRLQISKLNLNEQNFQANKYQHTAKFPETKHYNSILQQTTRFTTLPKSTKNQNVIFNNVENFFKKHLHTMR